MLAEAAGVDLFSALGGLLAESGSAGLVNNEPISLRYRSGRGWPLFVIAGRQIVTAEKIEVLALGTRAMVDDGAPLASVLEWCRRNGAFAVLPWGVGKWMGRRRRIVLDILKRCDPTRVALGDNGGSYGFVSLTVRVESRARLKEAVQIVRSIEPRGQVKAELLDDVYAARFGDRLMAMRVIGAFGVLAWMARLFSMPQASMPRARKAPTSSPLAEPATSSLYPSARPQTILIRSVR